MGGFILPPPRPSPLGRVADISPSPLPARFACCPSPCSYVAPRGIEMFRLYSIASLRSAPPSIHGRNSRHGVVGFGYRRSSVGFYIPHSPPPPASRATPSPCAFVAPRGFYFGRSAGFLWGECPLQLGLRALRRSFWVSRSRSCGFGRPASAFGGSKMNPRFSVK